METPCFWHWDCCCRWHFGWPRPGLITLRNDVTPCHQSSAKRLLETCIALDWMACYKSMAEIANIFKTGRLHLCMGSNTDWPRVSGWSCTLLCFLHLASLPIQEVNNDVNNMCRPPSYRLWLWKYVASEPRSGDSPVRIMGAYPKALCSCKPAASKVHQVHLQIRPGAMKAFRPSSRRCCHPSSW